MILYLCRFTGFFLQFYPCTLLCLVPAGEESLRFPKKKILFWVTMTALLLAALFPLALSAGNWGEKSYAIANLYMLAAMVLYIAVYFWFFRETLPKKLLIIFLVIFYAVSQFVLVVFLMPFMDRWNFLDNVYVLNDIYGYGVFLWLLDDAIVLPVAVVAFSRVVRDFIQEIEMKTMKQEFFLVMFSTIFYIGSVIYFDSIVSDFSVEFRRMSCPMFLILTLVQCLVYWLLLRESVRRRRDHDHKKALEIQALQYENITREMENASRMRHDMRHWLNGLNDLLEQNRTEEMKAYLAQVIDQTARRENEIYCQNTAVNGLLQYYAGIAQSAGIRCRVQADCGDLTISPTDLTVIFGNAMENAIRACGCFSGDRYITIQVGTMGSSLVVQIENPCKEIHPSGKYRLEGGFLPAAAFVSTRAGGGYGLKSMEYTARKYGGSTWFRYDETAETFTTRIRMNLYPEMTE